MQCSSRLPSAVTCSIFRIRECSSDIDRSLSSGLCFRLPNRSALFWVPLSSRLHHQVRFRLSSRCCPSPSTSGRDPCSWPMKPQVSSRVICTPLGLCRTLSPTSSSIIWDLRSLRLKTLSSCSRSQPLFPCSSSIQEAESTKKYVCMILLCLGENRIKFWVRNF